MPFLFFFFNYDFFLQLDHSHSLIAFSSKDEQIPHDSFSSATADQAITDILDIVTTKQAHCSGS